MQSTQDNVSIVWRIFPLGRISTLSSKTSSTVTATFTVHDLLLLVPSEETIPAWNAVPFQTWVVQVACWRCYAATHARLQSCPAIVVARGTNGGKQNERCDLRSDVEIGGPGWTPQASQEAAKRCHNLTNSHIILVSFKMLHDCWHFDQVCWLRPWQHQEVRGPTPGSHAQSH